MLSNRLFLYFLYGIKYHVSYIKQNFPTLAKTYKRLHVDKKSGAPVGSFRVRIDLTKKSCIILKFIKWLSPCDQVMIGSGKGDDASVSLKKQTLTPHKLLALAAQVASGLDHLEKYKVK